MKKLLLLLLLVGPANAQVGAPVVQCNANYSQAGLGGPVAQVKIIQDVPGKQISVCGWNISNTGGASVTITFTGGTGTNCGTNNVATGIAITVGNGQSNIDHNPSAFASVPTGYDLCWTITGSGTVNAVVYYGIF